MPVFVFVGNPQQKVVRDRETGARRAFKADREEADTITMRSRDGKIAVHFSRDQPVRVEDASLVARLRGNNHFKEVKVKAALPVAEVPADLPQQPDLLPDETVEHDPGAAEGVVNAIERPTREVIHGADVSDAG